MKKAKKVIVFALLILGVFGFLTLITRMPASAVSPDNGGTFCDSGKQYYCWTSLPYWECRDKQGGIRCVDPVN